MAKKRQVKRPTESAAITQDSEPGIIGLLPTQHRGHVSKKAWYRRQGVLDYTNPQERARLAKIISLYNQGGGTNQASESQVNELRDAWIMGKRIA